MKLGIYRKKAEKAMGENTYNGLGKNTYLIAPGLPGSYPVQAKEPIFPP